MRVRATRPTTWVAALAVTITACGLNGQRGDSDDDSVGTTTSMGTTTTTEVEARQFYTVQRGDTLVAIANRFDIDLNALVRENGIADPTRIFVGQQLLIPPPPDEADGPQLTIAPPTNPDLPPIMPTITVATTSTSTEPPSGSAPVG